MGTLGVERLTAMWWFEFESRTTHKWGGSTYPTRLPIGRIRFPHIRTKTRLIVETSASTEDTGLLVSMVGLWMAYRVNILGSDCSVVDKGGVFAFRFYIKT